MPLAYMGSHIRIAVVLVASGWKLEAEGSEPHRKYAKRLIYSGQYDAVYLMARDRSMPAVKDVVRALEADGRVDSVTCHEFKLRPDFAKRKMKRDRAVIACMVCHHGGPIDEVLDDDLGDFQVERFDPADEERSPSPSQAMATDSGRRERP